jgi:lipopolysaccharide transport system permease protein
LQQLVSFGVQLLMFATPVIYPLSTVKGLLRWVVLLNPLTPLVETFRLAFLGAGTFSPFYLLYSLIFMLVVFFGGVLLFNHVETTFMDTI